MSELASVTAKEGRTDGRERMARQKREKRRPKKEARREEREERRPREARDGQRCFAPCLRRGEATKLIVGTRPMDLSRAKR